MICADIVMAANDDSSLLDDPQTPSVTRARSQSKTAAADKAMSRDDMLRQELANVRKVNEAIEGVLKSLDKTKANMKVRKSCRLSLR